jgi:peptidoglycan-associated lipoprotein
MRRYSVLLLLVAAAAGACGKKAPVAAFAQPPVPSTPVAAMPAPTPPPAPPVAAAPAAASISDDELFARKSLSALNAERPLADIFFEFDSSTLRDDARGLLNANAAWLRRWTSTRILVEGHADDRGTPEYNLALGDVRARQVQTYLQALGITPDRIHIVTKGEEQPVCAQAAESCWSQNRRAHFLIVSK